MENSSFGPNDVEEAYYLRAGVLPLCRANVCMYDILMVHEEHATTMSYSRCKRLWQLTSMTKRLLKNNHVDNEEGIVLCLDGRTQFSRINKNLE